MRNPELASDRTKSDAADCEDIERIYKASGKRYGARKVWHGLRREGKDIVHCTVERLMKSMEIQGVVRGGKVIMSELKKHGVEVPRDISIIGFDDIDVAQYFNPPLITISQPRFELGVVAAKLLIEKLKNNSDIGIDGKTVLPVELVIRGSTARIEIC